MRSISKQFLTKQSLFSSYFFCRPRFFVFWLTKIKSLESWLPIYLLLFNFSFFIVIIKFLSCPLISFLKLGSKVVISLNFNISWFWKISRLFKLVSEYYWMLLEFSVWQGQLWVIKIFCFFKLIVDIGHLRWHLPRYSWHVGPKIWCRTRWIFSSEDQIFFFFALFNVVYLKKISRENYFFLIPFI